jgi:chemosensory pili system protein ChpA (sensor histidine kinase/response regulator)
MAESAKLLHSNTRLSFTELVSNKRVLLVDDEADQFKIVSAYFKKTQVHLDWCAKGQEAIAALRKHCYDLLILDIMMEGLDGWALFSQLREMSKYKEVPVLFLTCIMSPELEMLATDEIGNCRTLSKPASRSTFQDAVQRLLA